MLETLGPWSTSVVTHTKYLPRTLVEGPSNPRSTSHRTVDSDVPKPPGRTLLPSLSLTHPFLSSLSEVPCSTICDFFFDLYLTSSFSPIVPSPKNLYVFKVDFGRRVGCGYCLAVHVSGTRPCSNRTTPFGFSVPQALHPSPLVSGPTPIPRP